MQDNIKCIIYKYNIGISIMLGCDRLGYVLTEKGLVLPVIMPLVFQLMFMIDIQRKLSQRLKCMVTVVWYLFGIGIGYLLYIYGFDNYLCYIWILLFVLGYPVLYAFSRLGDSLNQKLSVEEQKNYNKIINIFLSIVGIMIIAFVCLEGFWKFIVNNLEYKIAIISKILYTILGISCIFRGILLKKICLVEK